jgi:hypothetical protein
MPAIDLKVNLNLPATPQGVPQELFSEFNRLYNALRNLASYLSTVATEQESFLANRGGATLVAGTATINNINVTNTTAIFLTTQVLGTVTAPKAIAVTSRIPGVSFTIRSADATDTSSVAWWFVP